MDTPLFLDIEASSAEPDAFPVAIAWSNGHSDILHCLISPVDDWSDASALQGHLSVDELRMRGESPWDVIKSLNADLADETVYVDGLNEDERWLFKLYDAFNTEPAFNIQPIQALLPDLNNDQLDSYRQEIFHEFGLDIEYPESHVRAMQIIFQRLTLLGSL